MYLTGIVVAAGFILLLCLARREEGKPLERMALYLYKRGCIYRIPLLNAHHVQRDLESLYPGQSGLLLQGEYYRKKIGLLLAVLGVGTLLGVLASVGADMGRSLNGQGELLRPDRGEAAAALEEDGATALWIGRDVPPFTASGMAERAKGSYRVEVSLQDEAGRQLWSVTLPAARSIHMESQRVGSVTPWDNHNPCLYRLLLTLLGPEDEILELVPYDIGFRRIEIVDKVIRLNGRRLVFTGVNRHEWSATGGRVITERDMEQDIRIFEENHINAVRTSHYPNRIPWYYLCDRHGIYMISETNLETHGSWQKPGGDETSWNIPGSFPAWREAVLDRARTHFETFKNHPAILMWSLGNESHAGDNLAAMHAFFKEKDPGRLVHYEGVVHNRAYEDRISDVESQMYAPPEGIAEYLSNAPKKPFILCEYMHDMGNSMGGMKSYMDLLDRFEMYQGAFIWDYMDQAIEVEDEVTGRKVLRYGGDFEDRPADYEFSGNGILFADRTPKPALQEVRYYYGKYR